MNMGITLLRSFPEYQVYYIAITKLFLQMLSYIFTIRYFFTLKLLQLVKGAASFSRLNKSLLQK